MKKKDILPHLITLIIAVLISSLVSVAASGHLFDSTEVVYDNTSSGMSSSNVKDAVDELYAAANDYSSINGRVTSLEGYFLNNPTSLFDGHDLQIAKNETGNNYAFIDFFRNGKNRAGVGVDAETGNLEIIAKDESQNQGRSNIVMKAQSVKINSSEIITESTKTAFQATLKVSDGAFNINKCFKVGNICSCNIWISHLNATNFPAAAEVTLAQIPAAYKPSYRAWAGISFTGTGVTGESLYAFLDENGNIVARHSGTINAIMLTFTWVL